MFLVRHASEVMEKDVILLSADADFDAFLRSPETGIGLKHVVVTRGDHIVGVVRVNTALRRGLETAYTGVSSSVAQRNFIIAREDDILFDVVTRMTRRDAAMAVVTRNVRRPHASDVVGIISKEHIADSVAESIRPYVHSVSTRRGAMGLALGLLRAQRAACGPARVNPPIDRAAGDC